MSAIKGCSPVYPPPGTLERPKDFPPLEKAALEGICGPRLLAAAMEGSLSHPEDLVAALKSACAGGKGALEKVQFLWFGARFGAAALGSLHSFFETHKFGTNVSSPDTAYVLNTYIKHWMGTATEGANLETIVNVLTGKEKASFSENGAPRATEPSDFAKMMLSALFPSGIVPMELSLTNVHEDVNDAVHRLRTYGVVQRLEPFWPKQHLDALKDLLKIPIDAEPTQQRSGAAEIRTSATVRAA